MNIFDGYNVLTVYHIWAMVMAIIALMATCTLDENLLLHNCSSFVLVYVIMSHCYRILFNGCSL